MFCRFAFVAFLLSVGLLQSARAVEFTLSDQSKNTSPQPTLAPTPQYPDSTSLLDEISEPAVPDIMMDGVLDGVLDGNYPTPAEPTIADHGIVNQALPQADVEIALPEVALEPVVLNDNSYGVAIADGNIDQWAYDCDACDGDACDMGLAPGVVPARGRKKENRWCLDLWIDQGFTANADSPASNFNLPVTFNDRSNEYQLNQLYLTFGRRVASTGDWFDLGGRVDLLYGTDYFFTQALGLETHGDGSPQWNSSDGPRSTGAALYGLAMPQAYLEGYLPVLGGINVKVGHFYTTIGYESVMAPENFFYSHSYNMQYGEPFTHTGVLASFDLGERLNGHFAYTRGWDTWEDPNDTPAYLFGFSWTPSDIASLAATVIVGREDDTGNNQRTLVSIVYTRQLTTCLRYVYQTDIGTEANAEFDQNFQPDSAKWYGAVSYLFLDLSDRCTAGMRFEWFRDQDNARVLGIPQEALVDGGNYYEITAGFNWAATSRLMFRPELRWDWSNVEPAGPGSGMYIDFTQNNQFLAAMDVIYTF